MRINDRLKDIFMRVFNLDDNEADSGLEYEKTKNWTSMGHLMLITEIESEFGISLAPDEVLVMGTVQKIEEIIDRHLQARNG